MTTLNPGSMEAIKKGCLCSHYDNAKGRDGGIDGKGNFWITETCPLHGIKSEEK